MQVHGRGRMYVPTPPQTCSWPSCVRPPGMSWRWKPVTVLAVATRAPRSQHWTMTAVSRRLSLVLLFTLKEIHCTGYKYCCERAVTNLCSFRHNSTNQIPPGKERRCQEAVFYWLSCDPGHSGSCTALHHSQETQGKEAEETKRWERKETSSRKELARRTKPSLERFLKQTSDRILNEVLRVAFILKDWFVCQE